MQNQENLGYLTIETSDNKYSFFEKTILIPAGGFEKTCLCYINLPCGLLQSLCNFEFRNNNDDSVQIFQ